MACTIRHVTLRRSRPPSDRIKFLKVSKISDANFHLFKFLINLDEEKLTRDSCLCDACFRHVDRRANCPGYKSKLRFSTSPNTTQNSGGAGPSNQSQNNPNNFDRTFGVCNVIDCEESAVHSIRKKWFIKMRRTIAKIFQVNLDLQPTNTNVSICEEHFAALSHIMVCAMCKRKLPRNHIFYINQVSTSPCQMLFNY